MPLTYNKYELDPADPLLKELTAIEWWDAHYFRNRFPDECEKSAFLAPQERRSEILSKISPTGADRRDLRKDCQLYQGDAHVGGSCSCPAPYSSH